MAKRTLGRGRSFLASASATVTLVDAYGNSVRGARVYVLWSGLASGRLCRVADVSKNGWFTIQLQMWKQAIA